VNLRRYCPLCNSELTYVKDHTNFYFCPNCTVWYKSVYGELSRPFVKPPWENPEAIKFVPSVQPQKPLYTTPLEPSEELSPAQKKWVQDTVAQLTNDPRRIPQLYAILMKAFTGEGDFWSAVQQLRAESGFHLHFIFQAMKKALQQNPEALKEIEAEGVQLPFMMDVPPRGAVGAALKGVSAKKHLTVRPA